MMIFSNS
jgi:hypothetical protein